MTAIVVTAVFTAKEDAHEQLVEALRASIPAVHSEKGCELYAIHDAEDGTVTMLEKWTSVEDLDAHGVGPAVAALNRAIEPFIAGPVRVTRMNPIAAGTEAQGLL